MANLTASGTTPTVTWQDDEDNDFRMVADADALTVSENTGSWQERFVFKSDANTSKVALAIETPQPIITFTDTTSGAKAFRFKVNSDTFFAQGHNDDSPPVFVNWLESDGTYLFAPGGVVAGHGTADSGEVHAIAWKVFELTLDDSPGGTYVFSVSSDSPAEIADQVVGVILMLTNDTSLPKTYQVYDSQASPNAGFYVEVKRQSSSNGGDEVHVTYDTSTYSPDVASLVGIVFYEV